MKKLFCSQPKLLIVIELKLAEILGVCGIVGILYGLGIVVVNYTPLLPAPTATWPGDFWIYPLRIFGGILAICMVFASFFTGYGIAYGVHCAIKANWAWADRIKNK